MGWIATISLLTLWTTAWCQTPTVAASTPETTLRAFETAFNKKDFSAMAVLCVGGKAYADFSQMIKMASGQFPSLKISNVKSVVDGATAKVSYHLEAAVPSQTPIQIDEATDMKLVGTNWLIVPAEPTNSAAARPSGLAMFAASLVSPKGFGQEKAAAQATVCLSQVKQLALGVLMFSGDNDDVLKFKSAADVRKQLAPYLKNEGLWKCPSDTGTGASYTFNPNLLGVAFAKVAEPSKVVMIYEGKGGKLAFRHAGRAAVAFMDGHAKLIDEAGAKSLVWLATKPKG